VIGGVALALLAGLLVWLLVRKDDGDNGVPATPVGKPVAVSESELRAFGRAQGTAVYWAGPRDGTTYELTRNAAGQIYIRYLPPNVAVGDPHPVYLAVGTYPVQNAYAVLLTAGHRRGYTSTTTASGALVVSRREAATSAYFTFPNAAIQVEAYHPRPGRALQMVLSGQIVQLR
jgi:hypothetical protein